ncbi:uncharacterized protein si:dkey-181m9.8 isoform X2 [Clupea harengus]|uniref:Uncharacterized protein si:dkey-181m9.8 isoform X2 n=1 Tax=Clupea harengus TaxID=7950 RepID=A0A6P8F2J8_CLUHA|nr:uncharacterized protein si:dkey-181m9.8 isoform X2 [Clupea harengus]
MARVTAGQEYDTLAECNYCSPNEVLADVRSATATYTDLNLHVDFYCYPNNEKKKLVYLGGTIPVVYEGNVYNIPIRIWIHETHPKSPPKCSVCPSVFMVINAKSSFVDASGHVHLHCLNNWKIGWSSLSIVLEEMRAAFQRETPLFTAFPVGSVTLSTPPLPPLPGSADANASPYDSWPYSDSMSSQQNTSDLNRMSSSCAVQPDSNTLPKSSKSSQSLATREPVSVVRRSYTQELLDMGITFEEPVVRTHHPTNPFLSSASVPNITPSNVEDVDNLFKSLQLEKVVNIYQLGTKDTDINEAWERPGFGEQPHEVAGLLDDTHTVVIDHLPRGVSPSRMKNKLTIYFQRKHNGGGEVVDVTYPTAHPDQAYVTFRNRRDVRQVLRQPSRAIAVNEQQFPIQVKKFDRSQVPEGIVGEKAAMFKSLLTMEGHTFSPTDVLEAVQACRDLPSALKYLSHECPICQEQVCFSKIITMTHCSCAFCESCFKAYFSSVIKEKSIVHAVCPLCNHPDVRGAQCLEESVEYFSLLDTQIRHYLDPETYELFQRKLRDRALQEMPNFRWCAHCCFGLLHEAERLRMDCPSCGKSTCFKCKSAWAPQHEGLSCEKFKEWQLHNSPEYQNTRLEHLMSRNKIDCPKCKFRFYLSKGGCLHFKCTQCQHEFCGGCGRPFKLGSACGFSAECSAKGLHAHHPRDCLYHLRDWSVHRLQRLLQLHRVSLPLLIRHKHGAAGRDWRGVCGVLEHKESGATKDEPCGRPALQEDNGYCSFHYKECLVELVNQKHLDPALLFDIQEMVAELQRWRVRFPQQQPQESDQLYRERLRKILTETVGLSTGALGRSKRMEPSSSSPSISVRNPWSSPQASPARGLSEDSQLLLLLND